MARCNFPNTLNAYSKHATKAGWSQISGQLRAHAFSLRTHKKLIKCPNICFISTRFSQLLSTAHEGILHPIHPLFLMRLLSAWGHLTPEITPIAPFFSELQLSSDKLLTWWVHFKHCLKTTLDNCSRKRFFTCKIHFNLHWPPLSLFLFALRH